MNRAHFASEIKLDDVRRFFERFAILISDLAFHKLPFIIIEMFENFAGNLFSPSCVYKTVWSDFDSWKQNKFGFLYFGSKHFE